MKEIFFVLIAFCAKDPVCEMEVRVCFEPYKPHLFNQFKPTEQHKKAIISKCKDHVQDIRERMKGEE